MGIREINIAGNHLVIHELDNVYDSVTGRPLTGSWVWDSALVLSNWMCTTHSDFHGKSVLELGAGAGVPGLVAARVGASRVVLTDIQSLLPALLNNVGVNGLGDLVEVKELVWGSEESISQLTKSGKFDVVLMSDLFFDPEEMIGLGSTLKGVCEESTSIWAVTELRPWTGECLNELTSQGFQVAELPSQTNTLQWEAEEESNTYAIFRITAPLEENRKLSLSPRISFRFSSILSGSFSSI